nr:GNAT family N-acetyltransferase [Motilimonas eburnea]
MSRDYELEKVGVPESYVRDFFCQQFELQFKYYQKNNPNSVSSIVEYKEKEIGWLLVNKEKGKPFHIIDITLLRHHRGLGIGSYLISSCIEKSKLAGTAITLNVNRFNPSRQLYKRLGFMELDSKQDYILMINQSD